MRFEPQPCPTDRIPMHGVEGGTIERTMRAVERARYIRRTLTLPLSRLRMGSSGVVRWVITALLT